MFACFVFRFFSVPISVVMCFYAELLKTIAFKIVVSSRIRLPLHAHACLLLHTETVYILYPICIIIFRCIALQLLVTATSSIAFYY